MNQDLEDKILEEAYREMLADRPTKRRLISLALEQRARGEDNWCNIRRSKLLQWFYAIKCAICILTDKKSNGQTYSFRELEEPAYHDDPVEVAAFDFRKTYGEYPGEDWEMLLVGHGFLTDWCYSVERDGYP